MHKFILALVDNNEKCVDYYIVSTEKTLKEVKDVYEMAWEEWHDDDKNKDFGYLIEHISMRMHENGMEMIPLLADLTLDF